MKKISYIVGDKSPISNNQAVESTESTEVGRGFNLTEMTTDYDKTDPARFEGGQEIDQLSTFLVDLADDMDSQEEEVFADFSDFLLKKIAEVNSIDYSKLFNQIIVKISEADISNSNELIKKLTKIFSRTIVLEFEKHKDMQKAKESAYFKVLHRAEQYLEDSD
jgi:hypothetical protein